MGSKRRNRKKGEKWGEREDAIESVIQLQNVLMAELRQLQRGPDAFKPAMDNAARQAMMDRMDKALPDEPTLVDCPLCNDIGYILRTDKAGVVHAARCAPCLDARRREDNAAKLTDGIERARAEARARAAALGAPASMERASCPEEVVKTKAKEQNIRSGIFWPTKD